MDGPPRLHSFHRQKLRKICLGVHTLAQAIHASQDEMLLDYREMPLSISGRLLGSISENNVSVPFQCGNAGALIIISLMSVFCGLTWRGYDDKTLE